MGRHIPDVPTIVIQNMPGAGGVRAANQHYNVSVPDGMNTDVGKFSWIDCIASNGAVLYAWRTAPVQKIEDAFSKNSSSLPLAKARACCRP